MNAINLRELRELAIDLQRMATHQKLLAFRAMLSPSAVLALLDELEHARTMSPAIRPALHHEIADFCAPLGSLVNQKRRKQCNESYCNASTRFLISSLTSKGPRYEQKDTVSRIHVGAGMRPRFSHSVCRTTPRMISSDSSFTVLLGIFIAMLYPAGVVRLFSKYIKEIKQ